MKKQLALLVLGLVVVLVLAGQLARAAAGPEPNDIQDSLPAWSSNGVDIAFQRTSAAAPARVLDMAAGGKFVHVVAQGTLRGFVPGSEHLLIQLDASHTLVTTDSPQDRPLAELPGSDAAASPDGQHVAYLRDGSLYVASIDGSGERAVATAVAPSTSDTEGPAWSPDGRRIAVASGSSLLLVQADGSGARVVAAGANPTWSPDGSLLAYERGSGIWVVAADGAGAREVVSNGRYPQFSPAAGTLAYISDRQHIRGVATRYQFALYVQPLGGAAKKLVDDVHPSSPPRWSASGALLVVSAGQECRRWGIYVVRADGGAQAQRRSNVCRFDGTARADTIRGSRYFDIINGNGGNDRLYGLGGNDKISGENGNDTIYGGAGNDFILGGPGNDRIYGGPGNDTIIPGNGRDWVDCGPGDDTVQGAGPLDHIAKNCEHVHR